MKKNLDILKAHYSEQIAPSACPLTLRYIDFPLILQTCMVTDQKNF